MTLALAELVALGAGACAAPRTEIRTVPDAELNAIVLQQIAAGRVGCPPAEIAIRTLQVTAHERTLEGEILAESWVAQCRGVTFHCTEWRGEIACARALPLPSPATDTPVE